MVMNSVPHIGHGTNSFSPTISNSKVCLHLGHAKAMGLFIFSLLFFTVIIFTSALELRDVDLVSIDYIFRKCNQREQLSIAKERLFLVD
jgi:hypothetical protein